MSAARLDLDETAQAARVLVRKLSSAGLSLACAESCTGGLAAADITAVPGASAAFWGGYVAYSNDCKTRILGVSLDTLSRFGAVSRETAREMAQGALSASGADLAFAITGIAGPEGGSEDKPVGLVWIAWKDALGRGSEESAVFGGDREAVRQAAALRAIRGVNELAAGLAAEEVVDIDKGEGPIYSS